MVDLAIFSSEKWTVFLEKTMEDYRQFCQQPAPEDAKSFMVYHNACKAVLGHLLLIRKIMENNSSSPDVDALISLMAQAKREVENDDESDSFE